MANQPMPVAAHWLELWVRVSSGRWTSVPSAFVCCKVEVSGKKRSHDHTECDVLMSVIGCKNNPLQYRMCRVYTYNT